MTTRVPLATNPRDSRLLAALPDAEWARWLPQLEPVDMPLGKVLDRDRLEQRTCECYAVVRREYDRLLPATAAS